jgi:hypothetical protein
MRISRDWPQSSGLDLLALQSLSSFARSRRSTSNSPLRNPFSPRLRPRRPTPAEAPASAAPYGGSVDRPPHSMTPPQRVSSPAPTYPILPVRPTSTLGSRSAIPSWHRARHLHRRDGARDNQRLTLMARIWAKADISTVLGADDQRISAIGNQSVMWANASRSSTELQYPNLRMFARADVAKDRGVIPNGIDHHSPRVRRGCSPDRRLPGRGIPAPWFHRRPAASSTPSVALSVWGSVPVFELRAVHPCSEQAARTR